MVASFPYLILPLLYQHKTIIILWEFGFFIERVEDKNEVKREYCVEDNKEVIKVLC